MAAAHPTTANSNALPPFERDGVSASFLRMFIATFLPDGQQSVLTTAEASAAVVKPMTAERKCAFIDLYRDKTDEDSKPYVGTATLFVSHAWKYRVLEPFGAMLEFADSHPNAFFWFDMFTNNQHKATELPLEWWKSTFRGAIGEIGHVMLVLSPWDKPIPITRAWCLWEIMCSIDQPHVKFECVIPESMRQVYLDRLVEDPFSIMLAISGIRAEHAEAMNPSDRDMIFQAIESTVGFLEMNKRVNMQLREKYLEAAIHGVEQMSRIDEAERMEQLRFAKVLGAVGYIHDEFGDYDQAMVHYQRALAIYLRTLGEDHDLTARTYHDIGKVHLSRGNHDQALVNYERALTFHRRMLGDDHENTAASYNDIGTIYYLKRDYDQALMYYQLRIISCWTHSGIIPIQPLHTATSEKCTMPKVTTNKRLCAMRPQPSIISKRSVRTMSIRQQHGTTLRRCT
jgi:hypothetical protein